MSTYHCIYHYCYCITLQILYCLIAVIFTYLLHCKFCSRSHDLNLDFLIQMHTASLNEVDFLLFFGGWKWGVENSCFENNFLKWSLFTNAWQCKLAENWSSWKQWRLGSFRCVSTMRYIWSQVASHSRGRGHQYLKRLHIVKNINWFCPLTCHACCTISGYFCVCVHAESI